VHFRFSLCGSVPEIFAIKVESGEKSRQILDVFALPNFIEGGPPKVIPSLSCLPQAGHMEKFREVIPTSPKVIGTHMLNFKSNFKCSPLKFFGDPCPRLAYVLTYPGHSLVRVKKFEWPAPPKG